MHLLRGTAPHVAADVRLAAQLVAQPHELVGAKAVVLDHAAPVGVDHALAVCLRADAVLPVVLVGKAAARPAQVGNVQLLECLDYGLVVAMDVGNGGLFSHPETAINAPSKVLREVPVDVRAYGWLPAVGVNNDGLFHTAFIVARVFWVCNKKNGYLSSFIGRCAGREGERTGTLRAGRPVRNGGRCRRRWACLLPPWAWSRAGPTACRTCGKRAAAGPCRLAAQPAAFLPAWKPTAPGSTAFLSNRF